MTNIAVNALPSVTGLQINDTLVLDRAAGTKGATFTQIQDANSNSLLKFTAVAAAVNQITLSNNSTTNAPILSATGTDGNVGFVHLCKGTGQFTWQSAHATTPVIIQSGTGLQHTASFAFTNAATSYTYTFPEANITVAGQAVSAYGTGASSFTAYAPVLGGTTSTGALQSAASGSTGQVFQSNGNAAKPTWSTPTYPSASGTARKILVSDGTNNVYSTETYAVPGSQYKIMQSDGTNWASATVTGSGAPVCQISPTLTTPSIGTINDTGGAPGISITPVASGVNYLNVLGSASGGGSVNLTATGTDTNINWGLNAKGSGSIYIGTTGTNPLILNCNSIATSIVCNASTTRTVTFPDASGTATLLGNSSTGSGSVVLATSPTITTPKIAQINDTNGNAILTMTTTASAVNYLTMKNTATGNAPTFGAAGSDSNVSFFLAAQGTGSVYIANAGSNYFQCTPAATGNNPSISLQGDANQSLSLLGNGTGGVILKGTGTNDSAAAGKVGEFITSNIASGSAISVSNTTAKDVTSISLTAGDWDVWGNVTWIPASTTSVYFLRCWISTTSATQPNPDLFSGWSNVAAGVVPNVTGMGQTAPIIRISVASTTTVYLSVNQSFTVSTCTACGTISARRVR